MLRREIAGVPVTYLDNAATSLKPQTVIDAVSDYYTNVGGNIHRGRHLLSEEASEQYENARSMVADFLGAASQDVVFTSGTTHGINMIARGLGLDRDARVLVVQDSHHSNLLPWRQHAKVDVAPVDPRGLLDEPAFERLLQRRPRVVTLTGASNVTGVYQPVQRLAAMAKQAGALVVLDAAQSMPHRPEFPVGVDYTVFSAHKMMGPTGVGVLLGAPGALERIRPDALGGGTVDWVDESQHRLRRLPHRLEAGTPHIAGVIGFGAAVQYLRRLGASFVREHDQQMARALRQPWREMPGVRVLGPDMRDEPDVAGLVSLVLPAKVNLSDLAQSLSDGYGVLCRSGHLCSQPFVTAAAGGPVLRLSAYAYNDVADVQRASVAIAELLEAMS